MKFSLFDGLMRVSVPGLAALLFCGCAGIQIQTPVAQIVPSENVAAENLELSFRVEPTRLQTVSDDASHRPPVFDNRNEGSNLLLSSLSYGANDRLEFSGGLLGFFDGLQAQGRYQFLGTPRNQGEVGWSGAVHAEAYALSTSRNGDQNGTFGPGGYNWHARAGVQSLGAGVSFGYRWDKSTMAFVGTTYNGFQVKSQINQDPTDDGTNQGGRYEETNDGHSSATGIGIVWGGGSIRLIPAVQWVEYQIDRQHERGFWWSATLAFGGSK